MAILPGVLGCRTLRRTVRVRLGFNTLRLPGGIPISTVSRLRFIKHLGSRSGRNWVVENETREQSLARKLKFVHLFPAGAGTFMAAGIFLTQYWKWFQTGEWHGAPMAEFVPQPLIQWAAAKDGGLLGLKEFVLASLSIHASVWFFVTGCVCTFLLMEITKPLLKD